MPVRAINERILDKLDQLIGGNICYRNIMRSACLGFRQFEPNHHGHHKYGQDEEAHALTGTGTLCLFVSSLQMTQSLFHMDEGFLDIVVNAVDERALLYDQFVQLLVDAVELVDGLHQLADLPVPLIILPHLSLAHLHILEIILHLASVFLIQLDGQIRRPCLVGL